MEVVILIEIFIFSLVERAYDDIRSIRDKEASFIRAAFDTQEAFATLQTLETLQTSAV